MLVINDVFVDERPAAFGDIKKMLFAGNLIGVEEADDGLGLRPPMLVCIDDAGWIGFVKQPAVGVDSLLEDSLGHLYRNLAYARQEGGIAEYLSGLAEQPASLNVVAEGDLVGARTPFFIKEQNEVVRGGSMMWSRKISISSRRRRRTVASSWIAQQRGVGLQ